MKTLLLIAIAGLALMLTDTAPTIASHPSGYAAGTVTGSHFGAKQGTVWIRAVAKVNPKTENQGVNPLNRTVLLSQSDAVNRTSLGIASWTEGRIVVTVQGSDAQQLVAAINSKRGMTLELSDFEFRWQVETLDGQRSEWN